jgi:hypothetical protein
VCVFFIYIYIYLFISIYIYIFISIYIFRQQKLRIPCTFVCKYNVKTWAVIAQSVSDSLRAGWSGDRITLRGEIFRIHPYWSWGPPSLIYNGYRFSFPGVKWPRRGVDHPPHLAPMLKKEYSYTSAPTLGLRGLFWDELYNVKTF